MEWEWAVGPAVSIVIAAVGWVVTWKKAIRLDRDSRENSRNENRKRDEDLKNLKEQIDALRDQADALKKQARIAEEQSLIPNWNLTQEQNLLYQVSNRNSFTALNVRIEFPQGHETKKYELGDIGPGSAQTFLFVEIGMMGGPNQVRLIWHTVEVPEERSVNVPVTYFH
jgi:hypothetical protein